jgi:hypothetical protein
LTAQSKRAERQQLDERYQRQLHDARFALLLGFVSFLALLFYYSRQELLLYGDAVAHINIARRVIDNRHPLESYSQMGTVWLPLQHVAMLPFVWSKVLWQSGIAGAIPGMVAYVLGSLGIFRLVGGRAHREIAYVAAAIYALNPNLLYMQATAMNEPIMLAFFIWALVYLDELLRAVYTPAVNSSGSPPRMRQMPPFRAMEACGVVLAGGVLTRYDGWFIAAVLGVIVTWLFAAWWKRAPDPPQRRRMAKSYAEFLLLNALVPAWWLIHTYFVSGRALDFATGPYSAKAIALRTTAQGASPYPGQHDIVTAGTYFLKSAKLNVGPGVWGQLLFALALAGTGLAVWHWRKYGALLLLWLPLSFYGLSIAYGSVPIFLPVWYPFSYYNVRYGLELLPMFAVFIALFTAFVAQQVHEKKSRIAVWSCLIGMVCVSYLAAYREAPITLQEARVNARTRVTLERALANYFATLPTSTTLLMAEGEHVGALQQAGVSLRRVVSEGTHPEWDWALINPMHAADIIVGCQGDPVSIAVRQHRNDLEQVTAISVPGQARCAVYKPK